MLNRPAGGFPLCTSEPMDTICHARKATDCTNTLADKSNEAKAWLKDQNDRELREEDSKGQAQLAEL